MKYRTLGRTGWQVSAVGFGAWGIGGMEWGPVTDEESMAALHRAVDLGANLVDTADVYGGGHSERLVGRLLRERSERIYVATKLGRGQPVHSGDPFSPENLAAFVEASLERLGVEVLDLVQLHTPASDVFEREEVFGALDDLCDSGKVRYYGASVETVAEAVKVLDYPNLQAVQIIFNMFRLKPAEEFLPLAGRKQVGILARVPLASGLLAGKMSAATRFDADDHRTLLYGGETFSGVPFDRGLEAVDALREALPEGMTLPQMALRWVLMHDAVTCAIPGAKRPAQVEENVAAADLEPLDETTMAAVSKVYDEQLRSLVHHEY